MFTFALMPRAARSFDLEVLAAGFHSRTPGAAGVAQRHAGEEARARACCGSGLRVYRQMQGYGRALARR